MSVIDTPPPVAIEVGVCRCAGSPHDQDIVWVAPEVTAEMGLASYAAIQNGGSVEDIQARLGAIYLRLGIVDWTFLDDEGVTIPVTPENVLRALPWGKGGFEVAERQAALYQEAVLRPLAARRPNSSPPTSITVSTSATRRSSSARAKRSA